MSDPIAELKARSDAKSKQDATEVIAKIDAYNKGYIDRGRLEIELKVVQCLFLGRIAAALEFSNALGTTDLSGAVATEAEEKAKEIVKDKTKRTFIGAKPG